MRGQCGCQEMSVKRALGMEEMSSTLNPRTLASGVKAISQVLNPGKIINAPKADSMHD